MTVEFVDHMSDRTDLELLDEIVCAVNIWSPDRRKAYEELVRRLKRMEKP